MVMPQDIALWLQRNLQTLAADDYGLVLFAHGIIAPVPGYSAARWQLAVDTIYRTIKCDLVAVHKFVECDDEESFFEAIRKLSPYGRPGAVLWNGTLIYGTKKLDALVHSFFPSDPDDESLNSAFIDAIAAIFAQNGVPWSDKPLLPIMPNAANSEASASS
jgi:hypothetical protein